MSSPDTGRAAIAASAYLRTLSPGALAEVRRMDPDHPAPAFWRFVARHSAAIGVHEGAWVLILRIFAILTPRGDPDTRASLHINKRRLGCVLCDGGDPSWPGPTLGEPKPVYSELRFEKLLASRGSQRSLLLTRAARTVAKSMAAGSGVNVTDIAFAILYPDNPTINSGLARSYYSRLDSAAQRANNQMENAR